MRSDAQSVNAQLEGEPAVGGGPSRSVGGLPTDVGAVSLAWVWCDFTAAIAGAPRHQLEGLCELGIGKLAEGGDPGDDLRRADIEDLEEGDDSVASELEVDERPVSQDHRLIIPCYGA
jgi:hypothetical protein